MTANTYKKLTRLYLADETLLAGKECYLSDTHLHYLKNVMRKETGDQLRLFNGVDGEWLADIIEINKKNILIKLVNKIAEQNNSPDIHVLASIVKKEAYDLMVEKSCELGAKKFIPIKSERSIVQKLNQERLQSIAIEAAEQSERLDIMTVGELSDLKKHLSSIDKNMNIIFCIERLDAPKLSEVAQKLKGKPVAILTGPEGGFTDSEIAFISALPNVTPISLGPRILRAETALISALSVVQLFN